MGGSGVAALAAEAGGGESLQLVRAMMNVRVSTRNVGANLSGVRHKFLNAKIRWRTPDRFFRRWRSESQFILIGGRAATG